RFVAMGHGVGLMVAATPATSTLDTRQPRLPPQSALLPALLRLLVHPGTAEAPPANPLEAAGHARSHSELSPQPHLRERRPRRHRHLLRLSIHGHLVEVRQNPRDHFRLLDDGLATGLRVDRPEDQT